MTKLWVCSTRHLVWRTDAHAVRQSWPYFFQERVFHGYIFQWKIKHPPMSTPLQQSILDCDLSRAPPAKKKRKKKKQQLSSCPRTRLLFAAVVTSSVYNTSQTPSMPAYNASPDDLVQMMPCEWIAKDYGIRKQWETRWIINEQQRRAAPLAAGSSAASWVKQRALESTVFY